MSWVFPGTGGVAPAAIPLDQLRARLVGHERVHAELRPDLDALLVHGPFPALPLLVFVGYGGASFSWQSGEKRHPLGDVTGAAAEIARYINRNASR
ncbi:hypothetical protein [Rhizohabitans arisaemae]|uniref:hypothetical protein n=1 Tax=Rhizohabitans arisaemae TaxID=2720610 RepID=UPI0024B09DC9|nr:hypothetical protein [Rhizohabitans arisaemae]